VQNGARFISSFFIELFRKVISASAAELQFY